MKNNDFRLVASGCLVGLLFTGCASTSQLVPRPDRSGITPSTVHVEISRTFGCKGWGNAFEVSDNGTLIGYLGNSGSLLWEREAGPMTLVVGPKHFNRGNFTEINMNLDAMTTYTFTASFPCWYPYSRGGLKFTSSARRDGKTLARASSAPSTSPAAKPATSAPSDSASKLRELKKLKDEGLLTDEEYEQRRKALVETL